MTREGAGDTGDVAAGAGGGAQVHRGAHGSFRHGAVTPVPRLALPARGEMRVRVRYCECDPMGVAHHAAYWPWLEMARTELLREAGVTYAELEACGVFLVIVKVEASYKLPAYYDDLLEVRTRVAGGSRVKIRHEYEVVRAECAGRADGVGANAGSGIVPARAACAGDLLMTASTMLACVDRTGRPSVMPEWLVPGDG